MSKPVITAVTIVLLATSCVERKTIPNADFCTNALGDETCAERYPDGSRPYCVVAECLDDFYGCFPYVPAEECASPCGAENPDCGVNTSVTASGTETGSGSSSESGSGSGSESSSTTGPMPCKSDDECTDPEAPFCGTSGECGGCDGTKDPDGACAGVDPLLPLCVGGGCVACTAENPAACTGTTPICDGATNTCVPCIAHDHCGGAACNLYVGACLPVDRVFEVGGATPDFPSLSEAMASVDPDTETTFLVYPGMPDYNEAVVVDGGRVVAFLAAEIGPGVEPPRWVRTSGTEPQLTVVMGATVLMDGLALAGNLSASVPGLRVDGGLAWVDRSRIVQNSGGGVLAENGAELVLRNCFVGGPAQDVDAIALDASTLDMLYTTAGGGGVIGSQARALFCANAATASVRNSILVSLDTMSEVVCPGVTLTTSATEAEVGFNAAWFTGYAAGDFSLSVTGATTFADIALWSTGDPPTDIDGDPRPAADGTPDYAGADVP